MQRMLLCRALISDPLLLILDEPTNFVDNKFEQELYALLKQFNEKMAIVMVSHDLGTISSYVRSIVCVNGHTSIGTIRTSSPSEQLHNYDCPIQLVTHARSCSPHRSGETRIGVIRSKTRNFDLLPMARLKTRINR